MNFLTLRRKGLYLAIELDKKNLVYPGGTNDLNIKHNKNMAYISLINLHQKDSILSKNSETNT